MNKIGTLKDKLVLPSFVFKSFLIFYLRLIFLQLAFMAFLKMLNMVSVGSSRETYYLKK